MKIKITLYILLFCVLQCFGQTWSNPTSSQSELYFNVDGPDPSIQYNVGTGFLINAKYADDINFTDGTGTSNLFIDGAGNRVGVGTTTPDSKFTVKGSVNIGADGNYHLKVRHVDGKETNSTDIDDLFLNYNNGKHVRIGFGPEGLNSNLYVAGRIGVGTNSPSSTMHVKTNSSGGTRHTHTDLIIEDDDHAMISILSPNTTNGFLGFADDDDDFVGGIQYNHPNDIMYFRVNNHASDMVINKDGHVGIGTSSPDAKLAVKGDIHAEEVKVDLSVPGPDYVFKADYKLKSLEEVQNYIKEHGHLPNIPSAKELEKNGIQLGEMNMRLLEKIEELTLYVIELNIEVDYLKKELNEKSKRHE